MPYMYIPYHIYLPYRFCIGEMDLDGVFVQEKTFKKLHLALDLNVNS